MRITADYRNGYYNIYNKRRLVESYRTWAEFNRAMNNLGRVREQLDRPEAFCDCQDIYTKGKR